MPKPEEYLPFELCPKCDHCFVSEHETRPARHEVIAELKKLAYIGEHHFPDLTWKARCAEAGAKVREMEAVYNAALELLRANEETDGNGIIYQQPQEIRDAWFKLCQAAYPRG